MEWIITFFLIFCIFGLSFFNFYSKPQYAYFIHYKLRNEDTWMLWPGVYETKQLAVEAASRGEEKFNRYNFLVVKDQIK